MDWDGIGKAGKIVLSIVPWIGSVFGLHSWAYNRFPKYYFKVVSLLNKWRDTRWSVNACYKIAGSDNYEKIEDVIKSRYGSYRRPVNMSHKKLYEFSSYKILVHDDLDMGEQSRRELWFNISQLNVTVNSAQEYLQDLREMFHEIEKKLSPGKTSYNMDVFFSGKENPFYGLMVQRLGIDKVEDFECVFPIDSLLNKSSFTRNDKKYYLRVFKEKLCINESSFAILEETAKRALLLK